MQALWFYLFRKIIMDLEQALYDIFWDDEYAKEEAREQFADME
jgi:hypothetical protein